MQHLRGFQKQQTPGSVLRFGACALLTKVWGKGAGLCRSPRLALLSLWSCRVVSLLLRPPGCAQDSRGLYSGLDCSIKEPAAPQPRSRSDSAGFCYAHSRGEHQGPGRDWAGWHGWPGVALGFLLVQHLRTSAGMWSPRICPLSAPPTPSPRPPTFV